MQFINTKTHCGTEHDKLAVENSPLSLRTQACDYRSPTVE